MKKILEIKELKKYYKENKAIDGLSFDLYEVEKYYFTYLGNW
ncbi:hypothetical protein [Clostridium manihotivorum]|nr:hypothetical protein [Clostridium manihotivorum]